MRKIDIRDFFGKTRRKALKAVFGRELVNNIATIDEIKKSLSQLSHIEHNLIQKMEKLNQKAEDLNKKADAVNQKTDEARKRTGVILDGQLFDNTIAGCEWLKDRSFSYGGWAMDSAALYTLFRILNDIKPENILEFGLGQSSKMVHQYANAFENVKALTIEQDHDWINFFSSKANKEISMNVKQLNIKTVTYNGFETLSYDGIDELIGEQKYNLVIVDGPNGSKHYSRSQIIEIAKNSISKQFCMFMDDTGRNGEKETKKEICNALEAKNIKYLMKEYTGEKSHTIICSEDLKFLLSLRKIYI